ncbi:menaquinone biosynthesis decarboxylase [Thermoplasma acidophilum]|uniref:menaquinone biosynthesis decarboxylase n=1 Tax=Thermoplasma acidophilum TaxID=2303 RepID=UPI00064F11D6|nr:menaquinone biosynthesis decarboxylase [Thermoplasma acidophilum]MCY0852156.1 menaquinone biosynthesis decarboxylase [Thermoplasma acidophilum]
MLFDDLHEYLDFLARKNDLITVNDQVDPDLELTYILSEEERIGRGRTIQFNRVKGSEVPAVGNLFSTYEKMKTVLGDDPYQIGRRIVEIAQPPGDSESFIGKGIEMMRELGGLRPKIAGSLPSNYDELDRVDLFRYPICKTWPQDGGKFITLPLVITKDPETGTRNMGMYRMQVYDSETTGMHWHIHKGGSENFQKEAQKHEVMDVAVVIGSDPLTIFSAVAPLPNGIDEFMFRGLVSKKRFDLVKGKTVNLEYPRNFEIVLEGYIDPAETRIEGPFGDHTGYYSLEEQFPVFHIKKIIERRDRIYPTTIVGKLWHEDVIMGKTIERMFLPLIQMVMPEVVDINTMEEAVFHNMVIVSIKKRYPGHAKKVMFGLWGMGQMMFSKIIVVVDDDINVHNRKEVIWAMTTRIDPDRDVIIIPGTVTDSLDHASPIFNYGSKMGIDATKKRPDEGYQRRWPDVLEMPEDVTNRVRDLMKKNGMTQ